MPGDWPPKAPTPFQLEELFRRIGEGQITRQEFESSFLGEDWVPVPNWITVLVEFFQRTGQEVVDRYKLEAYLRGESWAQIPGWIKTIVEAERVAHKRFFGREFDLSLFVETLKDCGEETIRGWQTLGLEIHYLPRVCFTSESDCPGWLVKPSKWYWLQLQAKSLMLTASKSRLIPMRIFTLDGLVVLIDNNPIGPSNSDYLGQIMDSLRLTGQIEASSSLSRLGLTIKEWDNQLKPTLATVLRFGVHQIRFETAFEANIIEQLYRMPRSSEKGVLYWCEEYYQAMTRRLFTNGGSEIGFRAVTSREMAVRPLITLAHSPDGPIPI